MFWRRNRHTAGHGQDAQPAGIPQEMLDRVRAIEIRARRLVNDLFLGEYQAVFRGRGLEFDELRPYVPGDDVRSIDWKAYARSGQPMIRRYREDRDLTVMFVVDVSASQRAGALPRTKEDLAAELCAVLALAAIRNKDRVGLLLFASKPERYVRPQGGATHVLRVVREVLWARPETGGTDIGAALEYLTGVQRRRATVFLVSDFLAPDYSSQLRAAALHHDIIAIRVREPLDGELPDAGIVPVRDAETGSLVEVDSSSARVRDAYRERVAAIDSDRRRLFGELGIDEIRVTVGTDWVPELLRFFKRRAVGAA
ncbi:MAG: DUF58 domain-containing protein [Thermoflexaceae bacterium]|jgi:uncharacterized protein (DUF58 family)|nr:DUF58 domain-containing protein [Thermoflexaceae bacterium]